MITELNLDWFGIGLILVLSALLVWVLVKKRRARLGLPEGNVLYSDTGTWKQQTQSLYAEDLGLVGKPDYLIEESQGSIIPVEIKSSVAPSKPHEWHILQLAAYCLLVEEEYGVRPDYGILQYSDSAFAVEYSMDLEEDLLDLLADMREDMLEPNLTRDHNEPQKCGHCGFRNSCEFRLL